MEVVVILIVDGSLGSALEGVEKRFEELEVKGRIETTALIKSVGIRILKTLGVTQTLV